MDLKTQLRETRDRILYTISYAPDFPSEDLNGVEGNFKRIIEGLDAILQSTTSEDSKHWLQLARHQIEEAKDHYLSGDTEKGRELLEFGSNYFENYLIGKPLKARFSVDPNGTAGEF